MYDRIKHHEPWVLHHIPQSGRNAVDVGANVGTFAFDLCTTFDYVYALEPDPRAFEELSALAGSPDLSNLQVYRIAAGAEAGYIELTEFEESVHSSSHPGDDFQPGRSAPTGNTFKAEVIPLDLLTLGPVDFIKVDVEGAEKEVLMGANQTIQQTRPQWLVEIHSDDNEVWCVNFFQEYAYTVERVAHPYGEAGHCWIIARDVRQPNIIKPSDLLARREAPALV